MSAQHSILETEAQRLRQRGQIQLWAMLFMATTFMVTLLPQNETMPALLAVVVAFLALAFYRLAIVGFPKPGTDSEGLVADLSDGYRTLARNSWLMALIALAYLAFQANHLLDVLQSGIAAHRLPADQFLRTGLLDPALVALVWFGLAVSFAWPVVWFRRDKNRTLQMGSAPASRAVALKFGYLFTTGLLGAGYVAVWMGVAEPLHFLLWAMLAAVAAPILLFVALEARAR
jgi:hypothetical protein